MRVSYLTDQQCREAYLRLLTRVDNEFGHSDKEYKNFWNRLGYSDGEIPQY
jgi:hypothetical protein